MCKSELNKFVTNESKGRLTFYHISRIVREEVMDLLVNIIGLQDTHHLGRYGGASMAFIEFGAG